MGQAASMMGCGWNPAIHRDNLGALPDQKGAIVMFLPGAFRGDIKIPTGAQDVSSGNKFKNMLVQRYGKTNDVHTARERVVGDSSKEIEIRMDPIESHQIFMSVDSKIVPSIDLSV
jgi:hypothetical protein